MGRQSAITLAILASATMLAGTAPAHAGTSLYLSAPDDTSAIHAKAVGDGKADDTAAIQRALDSAANKGAGGIVFLSSGRYRLTGTLFLWPGVRLIGVGPTRPVLLLGDNTPGFQQGVKHMLIFTGRGPDPAPSGLAGKVPFPPDGSVPFSDKIADANSGTFYGAVANVDIEIGKGNEGAAAIRFHAAQHAFLRHMDFHLGDAFAGVYMVGNEAEDLHFHGGRYGIVTEKTSPAWQFTLIDSTFEGQRDAAIREHEAGLTLINVAIKNTPIGIDIDKGYGDWLYGKDVRFENVSKAGIVISNEDNVYTQIAFNDIVASKTPVLARFRDSGRTLGQKGDYKVGEFTYGLTLPALGAFGRYETRFKAEPIAKLQSRRTPAIRTLPPVSQWTNVRTLGAKGDNKTDDTAALQAAINTHKALYFPSGYYLVSDTLKLKPDTVLIGLHPSRTQIILPDRTKGFEGAGPPKALIETAKGGDTIVSGLGLFGGGANARVTTLLWKAGENSLADDIKILGGHGTNLPDDTRLEPYDPYHAGDPDPRRPWDKQYHSIWVTDGGGGTFSTIWTANTFAQSGFTISDTKTPGRLYEVSNEHHGRVEFLLNRAENWEFYAPQTEEEVGESPDAFSFDIRNSRNILLANYHGYRVTRTYKPAAHAIRLENSGDIRLRNVHVNAESGIALCDMTGCGAYLRASKFPYENSLIDVKTGLEVREREFAALDIPARIEVPAASGDKAGPEVRKLADNFWSISGAAVAPDGKLYFVERRFQRIYGWSESQGLSIERDNSLDPVNLAIDKSGNILVQSSDGPAGSVYAFKPGTSDEQVNMLTPTAVTSLTDARIVLPVNYVKNGEFMDRYDPATDHFATLNEIFTADLGKAKTQQYVSPDGSLVIPAYHTWQQGLWRWSDVQQTYGFHAAKPGERILVTNGSENITYSGLVGTGGAITDLKPFANRGGESVVRGPDGRVYVANGQIFVYSADGKEIGRIDVPDRPLQLLFGGADGRTLYILTHHRLYSTRP